MAPIDEDEGSFDQTQASAYHTDVGATRPGALVKQLSARQYDDECLSDIFSDDGATCAEDLIDQSSRFNSTKMSMKGGSGYEGGNLLSHYSAPS